MHFYVMTLFPELIEKGMHTGVLYKAMEAGILSLETFHIRDYTIEKHKGWMTIPTEEAPAC